MRVTLGAGAASPFDRRDMAGLAAAAFASVAAPAFAAGDKGPPANLGGPMASKQATALGIVTDSKMPQFRDKGGQPIPPFKVAPLGKLDPKVRAASATAVPYVPRSLYMSLSHALTPYCLLSLQVTRPMFNK